MVAKARIHRSDFVGFTTIRHVGLTACVALLIAVLLSTSSTASPQESTDLTPPHTRKVHLPVAINPAPAQISRQTLVAAGVIMHDFEPPAQRWLSGHRGIDFAVQSGDPVYAIASGTVSFSGLVAGKPVVSVSRPDGTRVTYEPIASDLAVGAPVSAGDLLGYAVSASAAHCHDRCIHIGHVDGRDYLDPWRLMGGWVKIVLKPN